MALSAPLVPQGRQEFPVPLVPRESGGREGSPVSRVPGVPRARVLTTSAGQPSKMLFEEAIVRAINYGGTVSVNIGLACGF